MLSLEYEVFINLNNLEKLSLENNKISDLNKKSIIINPDYSDYRHDEIYRYNPIKNIKDLLPFNGLSNLKYLNLANNKINSIDTETFEVFKNLTNLYLQDNRLSEINHELLSSLTKLASLNISGNKIYIYIYIYKYNSSI